MTNSSNRSSFSDWETMSEVWTQDAIQVAVQRLHELGKRAMDQYFAETRTAWGTVPKPGPSHPLSILAARLDSVGLQDGIGRLEWEDVDRVWEWTKNREGLRHPLAALAPVLMMRSLRQQFNEDYLELAEDLNVMLRGIDKNWHRKFSDSELVKDMRSLLNDE